MMKKLHQLINISTQFIDQAINVGLKNKNNRRLSGILLALIPITIWFSMHHHDPSITPDPLPWFSTLIILFLGMIILSSASSNMLAHLKSGLLFAERNPNHTLVERFPFHRLKTLGIIIIVPMLTILSLLVLDLIAIVFQVPPSRLYSGDYNFLTMLYFGTFAVLGFSVSAYVASVRHRTLRTSEKQFEYRQQQDREKEIDNRFLEGIKLLGDKNESVRLGAIYILWEIVKDAAKALPYLDDVKGYIYYYRSKDSPIVPYITNSPERREDKGQNKLKRRYLDKNPANIAQIKAYKKAYSLHEQILNILCGHIRTLTNAEEYLLNYYPSIAKEHFHKTFEKQYGETSAEELIFYNSEEPSNEISILIRLLTGREQIAEKNVVNCLNFRLNFSNAILKGLKADKADLRRANLAKVNFQNSSLNYVEFDYANCHHTNFSQTTLNMSSFTMTDCKNANFSRAHLSNTEFKFTNCINTRFAPLLKKASFYGVSMQNTLFSYDDFNEEKLTFHGINGLPGFENCTSLEGQPVIKLETDNEPIMIHPNKLDELSPPLQTYFANHIGGHDWRIQISEAYNVLMSLRRTGKTLHLGETYTGYRSLELIKTRENLQVFYRQYIDSRENIRKLFQSLTDEERELAKKMFTDFDKVEAETEAKDEKKQKSLRS